MDLLEEQESGPSPVPSAAAAPDAPFATRRICPYLVIDGGGWRSAHPSRDHRCGAVAPAAVLAQDKQRRLCLTAAHRSCATWAAARALEGESPDTSTSESEATVTRWGLVRTTPVVLDQVRVPVRLDGLRRDRRAPQLLLGGVLVVAFLLVAIGRFAGPGSQAAAGSDPSPSPSAVAATSSPTPRPTPRPTPSPPPSLTPAPTASVTPAPTPSPTPSSTRTYTVRSGDTLYAIAIRFGTTIQVIRDINGLGTSSVLHIGQVLRLP